MKTTRVALTLAVFFASDALAQNVVAPSPRSLSGDDHGGDHWAALAPAYAPEGKGPAPAPIDFTQAGRGTGNPWKLNYAKTSLQIIQHEQVTGMLDNGHTLEVTVEKGSTLTTPRNTYQLVHFHFHSPSEHTFNGWHFPMEVHFVHRSSDGRLAVVAALFVEGTANENLAKLIANFPARQGQSVDYPAEKLDLNLQLPAKKEAYAYLGSLTTPPGAENVEWFVFREPVRASREQLNAFAVRLKPNNRPVQPPDTWPSETGVIASNTRK